MINGFEKYSFTRLCVTEKVEFFFIAGVNDADNFEWYWSGTLREVLGYIVIYTDHEQQKQESHIYLIEHDHRNFEHITKYAKQFVYHMLYLPYYDWENYIIHKTTVKQKGVVPPYVDFVRKIVEDDIPKSVIDEINY